MIPQGCGTKVILQNMKEKNKDDIAKYDSSRCWDENIKDVDD